MRERSSGLSRPENVQHDAQCISDLQVRVGAACSAGVALDAGVASGTQRPHEDAPAVALGLITIPGVE
jgi:hypothetical protein